MTTKTILLEYTFEDFKKIYGKWIKNEKILDDVFIKMKMVFSETGLPFFVVSRIMTILKNMAKNDEATFLDLLNTTILTPITVEALKRFIRIKKNKQERFLPQEIQEQIWKFDSIKTLDQLNTFCKYIMQAEEILLQRELSREKLKPFRETDSYVVYKPENYPQMKLLAYGTKWCVSQEDKYEEYSQGMDLFVFIPKTGEKYKVKDGTVVVPKYLCAIAKKDLLPKFEDKILHWFKRIGEYIEDAADRVSSDYIEYYGLDYGLVARIRGMREELFQCKKFIDETFSLYSRLDVDDAIDSAYDNFKERFPAGDNLTDSELLFKTDEIGQIIGKQDYTLSLEKVLSDILKEHLSENIYSYTYPESSFALMQNVFRFFDRYLDEDTLETVNPDKSLEITIASWNVVDVVEYESELREMYGVIERFVSDTGLAMVLEIANEQDEHLYLMLNSKEIEDIISHGGEELTNRFRQIMKMDKEFRKSVKGAKLENLVLYYDGYNDFIDDLNNLFEATFQKVEENVQENIIDYLLDYGLYDILVWFQKNGIVSEEFNVSEEAWKVADESTFIDGIIKRFFSDLKDGRIFHLLEHFVAAAGSQPELDEILDDLEWNKRPTTVAEHLLQIYIDKYY